MKKGLFLLLCLLTFGCSNRDTDTHPDFSDAFLDSTIGEDSRYPSVEPKKEQIGIFKVVWLKGTPYEMGYQHGTLLRDELKKGLEFIKKDPILSQQEEMARDMGVIDIAIKQSYPEIIEECKGLVDAAKDTGWSYQKCIILNFGDVFMEYLLNGMPKQACSQAAVAHNATRDKRLYHGRILDWSKIDYILENPTIFVRQPKGGIPHMYIGFPANLSPYSAMNVEGISIASNEAHPRDVSQTSLEGRSHVQMLAKIVREAHNLDEARDIILKERHMSTEIFMIADGKNKTASVFEMTAKHIGERRMDSNGVIYVTNHFLAEETKDYDKEPTKEANILRYDRYAQLLEPNGKDTLYGMLDPENLVKVLRDRINPYTGEESPIDEFDNGKSIATYGALFAIVFDPEKGLVWIAAGKIPVPQQPFVGFSLRKLLGYKDAPEPVPDVIK
ncbi:MAG: C45 family peptidase [Deltaproteobacteria bacterium]|nr:C45 family peptidase [Deltaproteobacteria bacterium]